MKRTEKPAPQYKTFENFERCQVTLDFPKAMHGVAKRLPAAEKFTHRSLKEWQDEEI